MTLPDSFTTKYLAMYGKQGKVWLEGFSTLREELYSYWSLTNPRPIPNPSFNYLEYVTTASGEETVLKIGFPDPELETEILALNFFDGAGAVKLLDAVPLKGALLLERITPGHNLLTICDDENATLIAGKVMDKLWRAAPDGVSFPDMSKWCQGFDRYSANYDRTGSIPEKIIQKAKGLADELLQYPSEKLLLHGDLHHQNVILGRNQQWLAIDPKGVIGEKAFEIGPLLYNPIPELLQQKKVKGLIRRRLEILEDITGIDQKRMVAWSIVRAALSSVWSVEDRTGNPDYGWCFAELLLTMI